MHLPKVKSQQAIKQGLEVEGETATIHVPDVVKKENGELRTLLVHHAMETEEQDNLRLMTKIRERMERVGVQMPKVEIRFQVGGWWAMHMRGMLNQFH